MSKLPYQGKRVKPFLQSRRHKSRPLTDEQALAAVANMVADLSPEAFLLWTSWIGIEEDHSKEQGFIDMNGERLREITGLSEEAFDRAFNTLVTKGFLKKADEGEGEL